ncbi:hypothetical protein BV898_03775 [Hypsibius exemplaris]|uniref:Reelin domain-containing protein n=1 Tax=Hypsibius exemplaris TaxID=2072580 RepID=A0A1W0X4R1_HYPEX|nr:hypothetical protein BV898_03775 [Hypsibius exemplaris]
MSAFLLFFRFIFTWTLFITTHKVLAFPNGAPLQSCHDLLPQHPMPAQNSVAPYKLIVKPLIKDQNNVGLQISVEGSGTDQFREFFHLAGFLIQVRDDATGRFVGKCSNVPSLSKSACNSRAAVTHTDNGQKAISELQFIWEPLAGELQSPISVRVYATFVKSAALYWTPIASMPILISPL